MSVVTSIEDVGSCSKKLTIEIPVEAVEAEMGRVVNKYRKRIRVPGFRRGKVPVSMVRRRFEEEIRKEVIDRLLPRYWHQAQAEKDLDPMLPPQVEDLELEPGKPMTVVALVDTRPEVRLGDFRNFDLPAGDTEPGADEIEDALTDLRRRHAEWIPVERRAARGDLVVARIIDGDAQTEHPQGGETEPGPEPIQVELGADDVDEELTLALTGMSAGGTTEYRLPAGHPEGGQAGHPEGGQAGRAEGGQDVRIEVVAVKEQELPEVDDEFALGFGLESAEALRQANVDNLRQVKKRRQHQRRERALLEQLRQRHPLTLPARVVDKQSEGMLQEYAEQLHGQGVNLDTAEIDWDSVGEKLRPEAERRVHEELLLDAVAKAEDLRLDENEFERFLSAAAAQQKSSSLALRQQLSESGRLEPLRAKMLRTQTVGFLLRDDASESDAPENDGGSRGKSVESA